MVRDETSRLRRYGRRLAWVGVAAVAIVALATAGYRTALNRLGPLDLAAVGDGSPVVLDRAGKLLRPFTTADGRWKLPVAAAEIDPLFFRLLKTYEDRRFDRHGGVDVLAMARASLQAIRSGRVVSGGSTLTMQVARLLEPRDERTVPAKARQVLRAWQLEESASKQRILDYYVVLAPYGGNIEGLRAASIAYFGKEPRRLSLAEAALLVALPQSPEARRPDRFAETARKARNRVIDIAVARGTVSASDGESAKGEPVPHQRKAFPMLAPHAAEAAVRARPGERVHRLSIDARLQASLEPIARERVEALGAKVAAAILVVDNATGEVRAHVGGSEYLSAQRAGGVDLMQAVRSPGSALKPFIYGLAFDAGIAHPETQLEDRPSRFATYAPENFDMTFQGTVTARKALQQSLNVPAVELLAEVGPSTFITRLRSAGADIVLPKDAVASLAAALGGLGIRPVDMAKLYAGLARGGMTQPLTWRLGEGARPERERRLLDAVSSWYLADTLRGTPPPTNALSNRISFKTGTSYGYRDAWAAGFDRRTTIVVWVGRPDGAPVPGLTGRSAAAPILFDAFSRLGGENEVIPAPRNVLMAATTQLPPPLQRLRKDAPKTLAAAAPSLKIAFPPDGARIDLGFAAGRERSDLVLKANGGQLPLIWMVNGRPVSQGELRRQSTWQPDGAGFARVSVMDAAGSVDSVTVRVE
ncbi:MAG TPA: penicillin-binding protein 1C [Beijerinckiaceae bacterium]|nr:penicillin-binding protein 1C [Beijerinckiaceae bacterium]